MRLKSSAYTEGKGLGFNAESETSMLPDSLTRMKQTSIQQKSPINQQRVYED